MIRSLLRTTGRRLLGPSVFDSLVQFRRRPVRGPLGASDERARWVFVEPHYDDVAFSCGGMLAAVVRRGMPAEVLTVFTADPAPTAPLSPLAEAVHAEWGAGERPYEQRRREAGHMGTLLSLEQTTLDLPEALYRMPHLTSIDEVMRPQHAPEEDPSFAVVREALEEALGHDEALTVVVPLGVGGHLDHLLVHAAIRALAADRPMWRVWYYEDFPYALDIPALKERVQALGAAFRPATVDIADTLDARVRLSAVYTSQVRAIFGTPDQLRSAISGYAGRVGTPRHPRERVWTVQGRGENGRHQGDPEATSRDTKR